MLVSVFIPLVYTQGSNNPPITGSPTTSAPATTTTSATVPVQECDPFYAVCPEYTSGVLECDTPGQAGRLIILSPNSNGFYHIGQPINITISFTKETNPQFPRVATVMYYRQVGQEQWTEWGNVTQGETSVFRTLQNVIPGAYEILALADGIDKTKRSKLGPDTSCTPDGWPFHQPSTFRVLTQRQVQPYIDSNGPSTSAAIGTAIGSVLFGLLSLFI